LIDRGRDEDHLHRSKQGGGVSIRTS
jgi:hypothetical protein